MKADNVNFTLFTNKFKITLYLFIFLNVKFDLLMYNVYCIVSSYI